jgi:serralysin
MKFRVLVMAIFMTTASHAGTYSKILWQKKEISVCFAAAEVEKRVSFNHKLTIEDWNESDKEKIKDWATSEYRPERTGIFFIGWRSCTEDPNADVILFYNKDSIFFAKLSGIAAGYGPVEKVAGYPNAKSYVAISKSGMSKYTVLHEFGHVAGLAHEHNHPDAVKESDKNCVYNVTRISSQYFSYEHFDKYSIMSYCNRLSTLSAQEVDLLKKLYPDNLEDRELLAPSLY